ncbi:hypothetical protein ACFIFM_003565 [Escherichia coli]
MQTLTVVEHENCESIEFVRVPTIDTHIFLKVGWGCDPIKVENFIGHYFGGRQLKSVNFETMLPENSETNNNVYLLTRIRQ